MLERKWINQRVGSAYVYCEMHVTSAEQLQATCIERTLNMIRQYRPDEDPEVYRDVITEQAQHLQGNKRNY